MPFGGVRDSGNGWREAGHRGARRLLRLKTVYVNHDPEPGVGADAPSPSSPRARARSACPGKNVAPLAGHPLIAYTIAAARESGLFDAVVVSTDSRGDRRDRPPLRRRGAGPAAGGDRGRHLARHRVGRATRCDGTRRGRSSRSCARPARSARRPPIRRAWDALHGRARAPTRCARSSRCASTRGRCGASHGELMRAAARAGAGRGADPLAPDRRRCRRSTSRTPRSRSRGRGCVGATATIAGTARRALLPRGPRGALDRLPRRLRARRGARRGATRRCCPRGGDASWRPPPSPPTLTDPARLRAAGRARAHPRGSTTPSSAPRRSPTPAASTRCTMHLRAPAPGTSARASASLDILGWLHLEVLRRGDDRAASPPRATTRPRVYAVLSASGSSTSSCCTGCAGWTACPATRTSAHARRSTPTPARSAWASPRRRGSSRADRLAGRRRRVFVLTGDGELQEGQFWESLGRPRTTGFGEITVIVDHNKIQSDTWVERRSATSATSRPRSRAFGWARRRAATATTSRALARRARRLAADAPDTPKLLDRRHGQGRGRRVHRAARARPAGTALYAFHSGAPAPSDVRARRSPSSRRAAASARLGRAPVAASAPRRRERVGARARPQRLVDAYGAALVAAAEREDAARGARRRPRASTAG